MATPNLYAPFKVGIVVDDGSTSWPLNRRYWLLKHICDIVEEYRP